MERAAEKLASPRGWSACGLVAAVGCFGLVAQALLFREFLTVFEGNELGIALFFTSWLLWVAVGALAARRRAPWLDALAHRFEMLPLLYVPAYVLQSWLITHARELSGVATYELFPLARMLPASFLANAPISLLTGLLFALACAWMARKGRVPVATVYICETVGSAIGGVAVTLLLWKGVAPETICLGAAMVVAVAFGLCRLTRSAWRSAGLPLLVLLAVQASGLDRMWQRTRDKQAWCRLLSADAYRGSFTTPQARYHYGAQGGQFNVVAWQSVADTIPNTEYASSVAALHLAQHPTARRFLVVGPGALAVCDRLLVLPQTEAVTWLDPDPAYPRHLLQVLATPLQNADARLAIPGTDIRTHLHDTDEMYDLVVLGLPNASTLALNRYFTREFFLLLKERLAPGAVVGVRVAGGANFMGAERIHVGASAYTTLGTVFRHLAIKPGDESWLLASDAEGLTTSPAVLRDRFRAIDGSQKLYPAEGLLSLYLPNRIAYQLAQYGAALRAAGEDALLNTDRHPRALFHSLQLAAREAGTALALTAGLRVFARHGRPAIPLALCLYALLRCVFVLKGRRFGRTRGEGGAPAPFDSGFLVFSTGAAGMALSITLMFMYQAVFGSIFLHVGLITALFMLGLCLGSLAIERRLTAKGAPARGTVLTVLALHAALVGALAGLPHLLSRGVFALLFFIGGLFSGVYVPLAASYLKSAGLPPRAAGAALERNDHLGGACGGLITGLILLPLFGYGYALAVVAGTLAINLPGLFLRAGPAGDAQQDGAAAVIRPGGYLLFGLAFCLLAVAVHVRVRTRPPLDRLFREAVGTMAAPSAAVAKQHVLSDGTALDYYVVTNAAGEAEAFLFSTEHLAPDSMGYGGPLTLAVRAAAAGGLQDLKILRSSETPAYLGLLAAWIRDLRGRDLFAPDALGDVDGVTGATVSSEAIVRTLHAAGRGFAGAVLGLGSPAAEQASVRRGPDTRFLWVTILTVAALVLRARPHRRVRQVFLALVVATCGLWLNSQYSLSQTLALIGVQGPPAGWNAVFLLVFLMPLCVLLFGNIYCGYLCPFGALQELVGDARPRRLRTAPDKTVWRYTRCVKYVLLFGVVIAFATCFDRSLSSADPLVAVFGAGRSGPLVGLVAALLALSFLYPRFWCRNLCPAGAFLALLNGAQLLKRLMPRVNAGLCPFGVTHRRELDCICCDRCRVGRRRERDALRAEQGQAPDGRRRRVFLACVAAVAAVFIGRVATTWSAARLGPGVPGISAAGGQARDVDMPKLRRIIERHQLSDREAMHYAPIRLDTPAPPSTIKMKR